MSDDLASLRSFPNVLGHSCKIECYEIHKSFSGGTVGNWNTLVEKIFPPVHRQKFRKKSEHNFL